MNMFLSQQKHSQRSNKKQTGICPNRKKLKAVSRHRKSTDPPKKTIKAQTAIRLGRSTGVSNGAGWSRHRHGCGGTDDAPRTTEQSLHCGYPWKRRRPCWPKQMASRAFLVRARCATVKCVWFWIENPRRTNGATAREEIAGAPPPFSSQV